MKRFLRMTAAAATAFATLFALAAIVGLILDRTVQTTAVVALVLGVLALAVRAMSHLVQH